MKYFLNIATALVMLSAFSSTLSALDSNTDYSARAFYGDPTTNSVISIDIPEMIQKGSTPTASTPYPVDKAGTLNKIYAITRGEYSIDILDPVTLINTGSISLRHKPRSGEAYNSKLDVQLIAGADKPMSSIIDPYTDTVIATAGTDEITVPNGDYGGSLASGHPFWFSKRKFAVIDRSNRSIKLYKLTGNKLDGFKVKLLDEISTPTSVHHFVSRERDTLHGGDRFIYYAVAEGAPLRDIPPTLLQIKVKGHSIKIINTVTLNGFDPATMGAHHADLHPDGVHIYMGSNEGHLFVINRKKMKVISVINTGAGSGHTRFVADKNLAIVTNHKDTYVTIIDTTHHSKITNVAVSAPQMNGEILQSHTSFVDPDSKFFYAFASDSGVFYELNLNKLAITGSVHTGGTPRQGVFIMHNDDD